MKFRHAAFAGLAALLSLTAAAAADTRVTVRDGVRLLAGPERGARLVATLPKDARVEVGGCAAMCRVAYEGLEAWGSPGDFRRVGGPPLRRVSPGFVPLPVPPDSLSREHRLPDADMYRRDYRDHSRWDRGPDGPWTRR